MSSSTRLDRSVTRYTRWVIRWRWPIVVATVLLTLLVGSGAQGLFFNTSYRAFFSKENPQLVAFEALQARYTKNDNVLFVLAPKKGRVFTPQTLAAIDALTDEAWQLPFAIRVDAITNFQHTSAEADDLIVQDLVEDAANYPTPLLADVQQIALSEPLIKNRLINSDAEVTGINVTLQLPGEQADEVLIVAAEARALADRIRTAHPDVEIYLTGFAMLNNAFQEISQSEMIRILPLMFGAMILIMVLTLRSFSGTLGTMLVIAFSTIMAMGIAGFFHVGLTPPSAQAPTIIMTLAIADSIHILVTMLLLMGRGLPKHDAIVESIRINFLPVLLTSLSTVIGFLSLNFSDVPPFNHLGNITAAGVTAAFVLSMLFLPALMGVLPVKVRTRTATAGTPILNRLAEFVVRRRKALLGVSTALIFLFAAFIPLNEMDDRFVEYFDESVAFRTDTDFTAANLTGIYQIEFSLDGGTSGSISDPAYLRKIDAFAAWYRQQKGVVHVNTFTDIIKRLNKNMHGDDPAYYRLPETRDLAAQYLLLYEMSLPYGLDLNNQINVDKSATRFTVTLANLSTREIRNLTERGQAWLRAYADEALYTTGSGPAVMFAYIAGINTRSMLQGSIMALLLISFLMIVALRSLKLGLISFLPNLFPIIVAFGVWGLISGVVNLGLSIVIGMTMGIVVDDSIHFLSKYRRARREQNLDAEAAVRYAFSSVGRALVVTSVILVIGFLILSSSAFLMNADMGLMTAITIALALVIDFFFLPPLLLWLDGSREATSSRTSANNGQTTNQPTELSLEPRS